MAGSGNHYAGSVAGSGSGINLNDSASLTGSIKGAVSDLHRDVTTRRCLTSYERVEDIVRECVTIKTDLDKADDDGEECREKIIAEFKAELERTLEEQNRGLLDQVRVIF